MPDPSNPQAFNRYSYVLNNPLLYTDPTGHDGTCVCDKDGCVGNCSGGGGGGGGVGPGCYDECSCYGFCGGGGGEYKGGGGTTGGGSSGGGGTTVATPAHYGVVYTSGSFGNYLDNVALRNIMLSLTGGFDPTGLSSDASGPSLGIIVSVNYWPTAWGSFTMAWTDSLIPTFNRSGALGNDGKIVLPGIYSYQYGQHPMLPEDGKVPYPALNVYNPLYKIFGYKNDRSIPAFNFKTNRFDTIDGLNIHKGNPINSSLCGGNGWIVIYQRELGRVLSTISHQIVMDYILISDCEVKNEKGVDNTYFIYSSYQWVPMQTRTKPRIYETGCFCRQGVCICIKTS